MKFSGLKADVPAEHYTVRELVQKQNICGGQGYVRCHCHTNCLTKKIFMSEERTLTQLDQKIWMVTCDRATEIYRKIGATSIISGYIIPMDYLVVIQKYI